MTQEAMMVDSQRIVKLELKMHTYMREALIGLAVRSLTTNAIRFSF